MNQQVDNLTYDKDGNIGWLRRQGGSSGRDMEDTIRFPPEDHEFARAHNIPVFTVGHRGRMCSTLGDNITRKHHPEANIWLLNRDNEGFLQTVNNRRREQQQ